MARWHGFGLLLSCADKESFLCTQGEILKLIKKQSPLSKLLMNLVLVLLYGYLLHTSSEWSGDHVEIGSIHLLTILPTLRFLLSFYSRQCLNMFLCLLSAYGWVRILLHGFFLVAFSYVFVAVCLDKSASLFVDKATEFFVSRFERNVLRLSENREYMERLEIRSMGYGHAEFVHQLLRYPMEDAQMDCITSMVGFPGGKPFTDQVEWRRNGIPLTTFTDRYSVVTEFRQVPESQDLKQMGLAQYELKSVLSIYLLDEVDFASYTCHTKDEFTIPTEEWKSKTGKTPCTERKESPPKRYSQCSCHPERKYVFQDTHTHKAEFRIIRMRQQSLQIEAPPSSILFLSTSYAHLSADEVHAIQPDYTVNDVSFYSLCDDSVMNGCSELQQLLAYFIYDRNQLWWFLDYLPFVMRYEFYDRGNNFTTGHCLCENSFGRHNMKYWRTYYNRTSEQYQLLEITHPLTLLVRPPKQISSNFLASVWNYGPAQLLPLADYLPESVYELRLLKDLAVVSVIFLNMVDRVIILCGLVILVYILRMMLGMLRTVGIVSRRLCLEGSMAYLDTAIITAAPMVHGDQVGSRLGEGRPNQFDLYLSHSDAEADQKIIRDDTLPLLETRLKLKVCLRDRDIAANVLELTGLTDAITNSKRFIIFFSKAFLGERCREMEISIIREIVWERQPEMDVLVIKLDDCEIPAPWADFTIHDWTSANLTVKDHQLRLVNWITCRAVPGQGSTLRSVLDVCISISPILLVCIIRLVVALY